MGGDELLGGVLVEVLQTFGDGKHDPTVLNVHLDDLQVGLLAFLEVVLGFVQLGDAEVADGHEAFEVLAHLHDHAMVQHAADVALEGMTHGVFLGQRGPWVISHLLDTQADATLAGVDVQDLDLDAVTAFEHFLGMTHAPGPAHVRDVDQAVDAVFHLDEGAEVGQVADFALNDRTNRIPLDEGNPGIALALLETQADLLVFLVDLQDHDVDFIADRNDLGRMLDVPRPTHLTDVDQALDTTFQLHEGAVVGDGDHASANDSLFGVTLVDVVPGIGLELLQTEADPFALLLEVQHLDLDLLADGDNFARVRDAAPAQVGDVQQAVDAAEIDEGAEVGDVLDHARAHLALFELGDEGALLLFTLLLEYDPPGDNYVPPTLVLLDDAALDFLADHIFQVRNLAQGNLAAGQERVHTPQLDHQSTLDSPVDGAGHDIAGLVRDLDLVPDLQEVGPFLGEHDKPIQVFELFEEDVKSVVDRDTGGTEFLPADHAFTLEADVEQDFVVTNLDDRPLEDLAFLDVREGLFVLVDQAQHLVRVQIPFLTFFFEVVEVDDAVGIILGAQTRRGGRRKNFGGGGPGGALVVVILATGFRGRFRGALRRADRCSLLGLFAHLVGIGIGVGGHERLPPSDR